MCHATVYCGKMCQKLHWKTHKTLCSAIHQLEDEGLTKIREACSFNSQLPPDNQAKIAQLVGKQCTVRGKINGLDVECLWDTGSQVALVSKLWVQQNVTGEVEVRPLRELIGHEIHLEAAGGSSIPYEGSIEMTFGTDKQEILVPFLVTSENIQRPIIGYNVITKITREDRNVVRELIEGDEPVIPSLIDVLT